MAQYGFRLFNANRMNGNGNTAVPFVHPEWGDFQAHLHRSMEAQKGRKHHENPNNAQDNSGNPLPLDPNSRIIRLDWIQTAGMATCFALSLGKNDGFRDAMNATAGGADVSIQHLAPRRQFRGVFVLPPRETEGVLALEVISRSCPVVPLRQWGARWSEHQVIEDRKNGRDSKHCRMKFEQMTDSAQVGSLLRHGDPTEIVLTEHVPQGNGLPDLVQYRLQAPVREKETALQIVQRWARREGQGKDEGIREARALVGPEVGDVEFDECYIKVRHEGQVQHVAPDAYSELFTYDITTEQRETDAFFRKVQDKMASIGLETKMKLDLTGWPTGLPSLLAPPT